MISLQAVLGMSETERRAYLDTIRKQKEQSLLLKPADGRIDEAVDRDKLIRRLESAGIHKRYYDVTFESIEKRALPADINLHRNYAEVKRYANSIDQHIEKGEGLIFSGGYGTMKTTMAIAVLRKWLDASHSGLIVSMPSLISSLSLKRRLNVEEEARYEQRIQTTPLLILDDLGGENTDQGWILTMVDSIITERYNRMLTTIVTTNLTQIELKGTYSQRIIDRLRSTNKLLAFTGRSKRQSIT